MTEFATGGITTGPALRLSVERLGADRHGHDLYRIAGGRPEHIINAAEVRAGDTAKLTCTETQVKR